MIAANKVKSPLLFLFRKCRVPKDLPGGLTAERTGCSMIWVANVAYLVVILPDHGNRMPERIQAGGAAGWWREKGASEGGSGVLPRIRSPAFSAIIITGA